MAMRKPRNKLELLQTAGMGRWLVGRRLQSGMVSADACEVPEDTLMAVVADWAKKTIANYNAVHVPITEGFTPFLDVIIFRPGQLAKVKKLIANLETEQ